MTGRDPHSEPEGSRLRVELALTDIEFPRPRLVAGLTLDTPVSEDSPLTAVIAEPLTLLREAVYQFIDADNSRRDLERSHIEAGKRLVREPKVTGTSRIQRPPKRGRGRLF